MRDWRDYIERDPDVMLGKPVFHGTRLGVQFILERLAQGAAPDELCREYSITLDHVRAAIAFAVAAMEPPLAPHETPA
jgi:uncharacterized protein (DUF433 family)